MSVDCEVWLDEKKEVGRYVFAQLPRAGDTVSLPDDTNKGKGKTYQHFRVDSVTHRAADEGLDCQTALNIDPGSASNFDPLDAYDGTPLISPAKRVRVAQPG